MKRDIGKCHHLSDLATHISPNNREHALTQLKGLLRSFNLLTSYPKIEEGYFDFMAKLLERGHAIPVPPSLQDQSIEKTNANPKKVWYLPHFGVYHPRKPNKIRVVFDPLAELKGTSLNKELLSGRDLHNSLLGILIRFRRNPVGVMCDIEQMFHSFHVHPPHRDLLRFLWFDKKDKENGIVDHHMIVHLFGNISSPVATYGLRKTAIEGEKKFGKAAKDFVVEDFYVDDGLTSCTTPHEATSLVNNTQEMLMTANLRLYKIASNSVEVMESFPIHDRVDNLKNLDISQDPLLSQRSLGVMWDLQRDTFTFQITLPECPYTRRGVLEIINSIYDPLGFATPVTLQGRLLLRELNEMGNNARSENNGKIPLDWDDPLARTSSEQMELLEEILERARGHRDSKLLPSRNIW